MSKIIGNNLPDMPWQEKPAGEHMPVWRYDQEAGRGLYQRDLLVVVPSVILVALYGCGGARGRLVAGCGGGLPRRGDSCLRHRIS